MNRQSKNQLDLFDPKRGRELKEEGMALAAVNRAEALARARSVARQLPGARTTGVIADNVWKAMVDLDIYEDLGGAAGSLFKDGAWMWTGQVRRCHRTRSHARLVMVWVLK
jgi:hypothetical protein